MFENYNIFFYYQKKWAQTRLFALLENHFNYYFLQPIRTLILSSRKNTTYFIFSPKKSFRLVNGIVLIGDQSRGKLYFFPFLSFLYFILSILFPFFPYFFFGIYPSFFISYPTLFPTEEETLQHAAGPWRRSHARGSWNNRHDRTESLSIGQSSNVSLHDLSVVVNRGISLGEYWRLGERRNKDKYHDWLVHLAHAMYCVVKRFFFLLLLLLLLTRSYTTASFSFVFNSIDKNS